MKKLKICFLCEFFYPDNMGSTGTIISHLARFLQDSYPEFQLGAVTSTNLYRETPRSLARRENWQGISIRRVKTPHTKHHSTWKRLGAGVLFTLATTVKMALGPRADVVIVLTNPPMLPLAALWMRRLRGTRVIYLIHDLYAEMSVALGQASADSRAIRASQKLQASFLRGSDAVVALGRCMKDHLDSEFALPPSKVRVITNWGALPAPVAQSDSRFRKEHGLQNQFVVLYAGNFGQFHNFDQILDAAKSLSQKNSNIMFALVGDGAKKPEVEARAKREGINNVRFFDFVPTDKLPDMLGAADVALITLEHGTEGLAVPCKFYNILAAGRASIAIMGASAETARAIEENGCGLRVANDDVVGLENAISALANDRELSQAMGARAHRAFEQSYTLEHIGHQFHDLIREVVAAKFVPSTSPIINSPSQI